MILTLVRHGETLSNATGTWQGQGDSQLSPLGLKQAELLGERLERVHFDRVVSSDLRRAVETSELLGKPYTCDPAFREIDLGSWEGLTREQVREAFPDELAALSRGEDLPVGGGESWLDVQRRTLAALEELRGEQDVLLVAHGGVILTLMCALVGRGVGTVRPLGRLLNTSMTTIELGDETIVHRYNDADHCDADGVWREAAKRGHDVAIQPGGEPGIVGDARLGELEPGRCGLLEVSSDKTVVAAWNVVRP
ncbi:MAG: histidine phosphatase family protein [Proteobacteria bacterium]|nr:histidine phosphatase family protein [Pseudomonadota bacterium]